MCMGTTRMIRRRQRLKTRPRYFFKILYYNFTDKFLLIDYMYGYYKNNDTHHNSRLLHDDRNGLETRVLSSPS